MKLEIEDVLRLAKLSRIELDINEQEKLITDMSSILAYISEIQEIAPEDIPGVFEYNNVSRSDEITRGPREFTDSILDNAPKRNGDYLEVNQVI